MGHLEDRFLAVKLVAVPSYEYSSTGRWHRGGSSIRVLVVLLKGVTQMILGGQGTDNPMPVFAINGDLRPLHG